MKTIASAVAYVGLLLVGVAPVHAEDVVPRDAWFAAMQDADPAAAIAMYETVGKDATAKTPADLAKADLARVRGRAVEFGREIPVDERTVRLQVHTSADAWLLLTWRRGDAGWRVGKTEELDSELFEAAGRIPWRDSGAVAPPVSEELHAFLLRWTQTLQSIQWKARSAGAEFVLAGKQPQALEELAISARRSRSFPVILTDREDSTGADVRIHYVQEWTFRVQLTHGEEGWRITEILDVPRVPRPVVRSTFAEGEEVVGFVSALERALLPNGSSKVLLEFGIDGDGAKPVPYTEASATLQLARWRARYGPIRIKKADAGDYALFSTSSRPMISFVTADGTVGGFVRLVRRREGWRILGLRTSAGEETEEVQDVVEPPR